MDINEQIAANVGLIRQQLGRFKLTDDPDAESLAYEALHKAIVTYDASLGNRFSTYATCVIVNALRMHLRTLNKKRQLNVVSYYELMRPNDEESGYLLDSLKQAEDTETCVVLNELRGEIGEAYRRVFCTLTKKQQRVVTLWYLSDFKMPQREIASRLGISQATVSLVLGAFKYRLKNELEEYL